MTLSDCLSCENSNKSSLNEPWKTPHSTFLKKEVLLKDDYQWINLHLQNHHTGHEV